MIAFKKYRGSLWLILALFACTTEVPTADTASTEEEVILDPEGTSPWHCDDDLDNDEDGLYDCDDPDCAESSFCNESVDDGACMDGEDNDGDGLVDCDDPDCAETDACSEVSSFEDLNSGECDDGQDNDGDGLYDCDDPDCADAEACQEEDDECGEEGLEIDIIGPELPVVGDEWLVWLRCDGVTLTGTLVLRFDPPSFASVNKNQVVFNRAGSADMRVQVGGYRTSMEVTVKPAD